MMPRIIGLVASRQNCNILLTYIASELHLWLSHYGQQAGQKFMSVKKQKQNKRKSMFTPIVITDTGNTEEMSWEWCGLGRLE